MKPYKVYVGSDRSQLLAVKVLEYSIKKHTNHPVEIIPMCDLDVPVPKDIKNQQRTGFSFSRFCIPQFMNYEGRAVYLDADMLVFQDIRKLFEWPFENYKILIQKPLEDLQSSYPKKSSNKKRIRQCAVMVLDCSALDWDISKIVNAMDRNDYDYEKLMYDLCILKDSEVGEVLPFEWNSLEHFDAKTCLIHYTDMLTQPWVSPHNKFGYLWFREVKEMLDKNVISIDKIVEEIRLGYFRPSLVLDIYWHDKIPLFLKPLWIKILRVKDILSGYKAHRVVSSRVSLIKKRLAVN